MFRFRASAGTSLVFMLILVGVGWFALTWPYHVGGWLLEIAYLIWLIYMGGMLAWHRSSPAPAALPAPARRPHLEHRPRVIEPLAMTASVSRTTRNESYSRQPPPDARVTIRDRRIPEPHRSLPRHPAAPATPTRERHSGPAIRLADLPPHGIGPVLLDRLAAAGIRTYADYTGHRLDRSGTRATVHLVRSDGHEVQVPGIGPDKAIALDAWCTAVRDGRLRHA